MTWIIYGDNQNITDRTNMEPKDLEVEESRESWNTYELPDKTLIKVKIILSRLIQEGVLDLTGNPVLSFMINTVIGSVPVKKIEGEIIPEENMDFKPVKEPGSEYKLNDGSFLEFKPHVAQINRINSRDQRGDPNYIVQIQPLATFKKHKNGKK